jgi:hypothetical protein
MENPANKLSLPFSIEDLIGSSISEPKGVGKLFESKELPNKIIRVETFDELSVRHGDKVDVLELVNDAKGLYQELESKYGIIVPAEFYTAENKVFTIVDKIEGKHLNELENSAEIVSSIEKLYVSVARYFLDKFKEGGLGLWDINGQSQYIYGKKAGEKDKKIYLIDTDIWLNNNEEGISLSVCWLTRHLSGLENHFNIRFFEVRNQIKQFLDQYLSTNADGLKNPNINAINDFLNYKKSDYNPKTAIPVFE